MYKQLLYNVLWGQMIVHSNIEPGKKRKNNNNNNNNNNNHNNNHINHNHNNNHNKKLGRYQKV